MPGIAAPMDKPKRAPKAMKHPPMMPSRKVLEKVTVPFAAPMAASCRPQSSAELAGMCGQCMPQPVWHHTGAKL